MENVSPKAPETYVPDFIVMDNGGVFYLHVIGLSRLSNKAPESVKH